MSKQPLLPSHVNDKHRLSSPAISFPSSSTSKKPASSSQPYTRSSTHDESEEGGRHVLAGGHDLGRPGLPKVSRECLISEIKCYGKNIVPVLLVNAVLISVGLLIFFYVRRR